MDEIQFFGVGWNLLSVTVYLASVLFITGFFKKRLKPKTWQAKVALSWAIGVPVFFTLGIFRPEQVTFRGIIQYAFLTLFLNGAYKGSTVLWDILAAHKIVRPRKVKPAEIPVS
jgi:hypothetical protein